MKNDNSGKTLSAHGIINKYADPSKISGEKDAWPRAAVEKYRNNQAEFQHADNTETDY